MRPSARFLGLAFGLVGLAPVGVSATEYRLEGPVTLSLLASGTTAEGQRAGRLGREITFANRTLYRISNREVLEALAAESIIPQIRGWRLVALWAEWPETGNGYRFFAQDLRNRQDLREIPDDILKMEILGGAVERRHTLADDDTIRGGRETFKMLARLSFADAGEVALLDGVLAGSGAYG